ncbi:MAG: glycosyltransferase family 39 protein [Candidatus Pacebacteria bacterium]|nr:glycosyltransferase family 39 protein [Candidatus Paceibacterota bacterium]MDR3583535.1 glycosyltransferase family 39 protein [Candidatus Paceibacterota bacterium]
MKFHASAYLKENKRTLMILAVIFLAGIFLRTYNFRDWMRFSEDQPRDATIISDALEGKAPLSLLGPAANETNFHLGPAYYYLSFASVKIFGNYPDRMAYPSLLAGILAIPFTFFFLRENFSEKISLALTGVMSVSYFMINASRFSSNPNLVPLFVILFLWGLLKILNDPKKFHPGWSALLGFSLGLGVQMHTISLVVMPIVGLSVLAYFWRVGGRGIWKSLAIVMVLAALLNTAQIVSELHTNFQNTRYFFQGLHDHSNAKNNYGESLALISACQIEADGYFLTSIGGDYQCGDVLRAAEYGWNTDKSYFLILIAYALLTLSGYYFLIRNLVGGMEVRRKNFLALVMLFNLATIIILMSVSGMIHVSYYSVMFFVPLVFLGLLMEAVEKRFDRRGMLAAGAVIGAIAICSLTVDGVTAVSYVRGFQNNYSNSTLSQDEAMSNYILETVPKNTARGYFAGQSNLLVRYFDPAAYLVRRKGLDMSMVENADSSRLTPGTPLYYVADSGSHSIPGAIGNRRILSDRKFFNQTIYILKN